MLCDAQTQPARDFCSSCEAQLPYAGPSCAVCAAPLPGDAAGAVHCARCQQAPPAFDHALALFAYAAPIDRLIQRFKYHGDLSLGRVLGTCLGNSIAERPEVRPDVLIPVPLHRSRLRTRGYNQALELAHPVARRLGVRIDYRHAQRVRATAPQTEMDFDARRKNVRGAFEANDAFTGLRVAIIDDVMTSGHTAHALAQTLRRAGAVEISVWVLARAGE